MSDETIKVTFQIRPTAKGRLLAPNFIDALETDVKEAPRAIARS